MPFCGTCGKYVSDLRRHLRKNRCGLKGKPAWHESLKRLG